MKRTLIKLAVAASLTTAALAAPAQELTGPPANPQVKYSTPMPPGIAMPDKVETRIGTLEFFDGFPDQATSETLWDNLDFQRAVQAFLLGMPARARPPTARPSTRWAPPIRCCQSTSS